MGSELSKKEERQEGGPLVPVVNRVAELKDGIVEMASLMKQAAALVAQEARRAEEIKEALAAGVAALEAQLAEKDEALRQKDSVLKEVEEGLTARIRDLESQLTKKQSRKGEDRGLEGRAPEDTEVKLIRRSMRDMVVRGAETVGRQEGQDPRKSGLASLLAPSKRKS